MTLLLNPHDYDHGHDHDGGVDDHGHGHGRDDDEDDDDDYGHGHGVKSLSAVCKSRFFLYSEVCVCLSSESEESIEEDENLVQGRDKDEKYWSCIITKTPLIIRFFFFFFLSEKSVNTFDLLYYSARTRIENKCRLVGLASICLRKLHYAFVVTKSFEMLMR